MRATVTVLLVTLASACSRPAATAPPPPTSSRPAPPAQTGTLPFPGISAPVTIEATPTRERELIAWIEAGDVARVKSFLEIGGDPNARSLVTNEGTPAIGFAMAAGIKAADDVRETSRTLLRLLLEHGADANVRWCDFDQPCGQTNGITPLMYAVITLRDDIEPLLREFGADPGLRDWRGLTAADYSRGVRLRPGSLCARAAANEPHLAEARLLGARGASLGETILAARGPAIVQRSAIVPATDDTICETAARAAARYWDNGTELGPRQLRPVLAFHVGSIWLVGEPGSPEQGYFDEAWRLVEWYPGPS
jgi:hypothetical protein